MYPSAQSTKNNVLYFNCYKYPHQRQRVDSWVFLICRPTKSQARGPKFKYLWGLAGNINQVERVQATGTLGRLFLIQMTPTHQKELHKLLFELSPLTLLLCCLSDNKLLICQIRQNTPAITIPKRLNFMTKEKHF